MTLVEDATGHGEPVFQGGIVGLFGHGLLQRLDLAPGGGRLRDAGAAEDHDGVLDPVFAQQPFGLAVIQLQANAAGLVLLQEVHVLVGLAVGRIFHQAPDPFGGIDIVHRRFGPLPGQFFPPVQRMGRSRNDRVVGIARISHGRRFPDDERVRPGPWR